MEHQAGPDLDALIAEKVMGWRRALPGESVCYWYAGTSSDGRTDRQCMDTDDYYHPVAAWSPSTSIADAWDVVGGLEAGCPGATFRLTRTRDLNGERGPWRAGFVPDRPADADTAPLAICRAALKALGVI